MEAMKNWKAKMAAGEKILLRWKFKQASSEEMHFHYYYYK